MISATRDIWQGHPSTQAWKVDQQQPDSITELHHAAWTGDISALQVGFVLLIACLWLRIVSLRSAVQTLLSQGANVSFSDKEGRTPLHYAAAGQSHMFLAYKTTESGVRLDKAALPRYPCSCQVHSSMLQGTRQVQLACL